MKLLYYPRLSLVLLFAAVSAFAAPLPKYGPDAVPLSRKTGAEYFHDHPAPDFWALIPYYLPQQSETGCSAANFTLVLNAARRNQNLTAKDELVTIDSLVGKLTDDRYRKAMTAMNPLTFDHAAVSNSNLAKVLREAAEKLELTTPATRIEAVVIDQTDLPKSRQAFHSALLENEKSADDFIIISFVQGKLTGDPEGGAHVATIGAYDEKTRRVLLLDPDRKWYEPYWSPEDKVFDAIADRGSDPHPGWIYFKVK